VPGDADDRVAAPGERQRGLATDPRRRTGDEDDAWTGGGDHVGDLPRRFDVKHL
jgi:hypothetical protein